MGSAISLRTDFDGRDCGFWLDRQRMPIRPDGSLHLRRSMTVVRVQMPPGWAV